MHQVSPRTSWRSMLPLAVGALAWALLWLLGAGQWGWLAFLTAGLALSATGTNADDSRADIAAVPREPLDAAEIPPGRYVVDAGRSIVRLRVRKLGVFRVDGRFTEVTGTIDVDPDLTRSRTVAAVAAASFRTRNARRDAHVIGPAFLDAARHPMLRFAGSQVVRSADDDGSVSVSGTLTVRGTARPVTFCVRVVAASGARLELVAETTLRRSDFGVTAYRWLAGDTIFVRVEACAFAG